jgi:hypothetical protein
MPRFVILEHDHPELHWDFMLEDGGVLRTWRFAVPPALGHSCAARQLTDHRLAYLDYEGPVSGGRGSVRRWEQGNYDWLWDTPDDLAVRLMGEWLRGVVRLTRLSGDEWAATCESEEEVP